MALSNVMSQSLISAGNSIKMARIQHGIKDKADNEAGVLNAEIKLDGGRGGDVTKKKEKLKEAEEKAAEMNAAAAETMVDLNKGIKRAAEEDLKETREEKRQAEKAAERKEAKKAQEQKFAEAVRKDADKAIDKTDLDDSVRSGNGIAGNVVDIAADGVTPDTGIVKTVGINVDVKT